jgi:hypothetical protein
MKGWRIDCNVLHYLIFEGLVRCYVSACASNRHTKGLFGLRRLVSINLDPPKRRFGKEEQKINEVFD